MEDTTINPTDQPIDLIAQLQHTLSNQAANARKHGVVIVDSAEYLNASSQNALKSASSSSLKSASRSTSM